MSDNKTQLIGENADFLFIYEAIQCNPNGDPDQENKPRMDYDTNTNLVTDVRVKRYIRNFLKDQGQDIFVDLVSENKVTMDVKLQDALSKIWDKDEIMKSLINNDELFKKYTKDYREADFEKTMSKMIDDKKMDKQINLAILSGLVREKFIDIRMFGSAFAVKGFTRSMTGPIQMNWGYSLNKVYLLDSSTISSIMNDGNSTFGKDYRVKYSLLAFHGSINKSAAKTTGLTEADLETFRSSLWNSISAEPTRSKLNQYPKLYVEIKYNDGYYNGHFGDLRNLISVATKEGINDREVRGMKDLEFDFSELTSLLDENKEVVNSLTIKVSPDMKKHFSYGNS